MKQNKINNAEQGLPIIPIVAFFFVTLFALLIGSKWLDKDFGMVMKWWAVLVATAFAFFPLAYAVFNRFSDGGYIIGKVFGLQASGWLIWALSTFKIMKFNTNSSWAVLGICAVLNYGFYAFYCKKADKKPFENFDGKKVSRILYYELLFLIMFIFFCYMKSFRVTITSDTEKYMDFGFLASIMGTEYMPANDMWYSGEPINYYYFGIYICGFVGKLVNTHAGYAYNLGLMTICSVGFVQVYAIVAELLKRGLGEYEKRNGKKFGSKERNAAFSDFCQHIGGMLGGFAVFFASNAHFILYGGIYPTVQKLMGDEPKKYWFPDATRFIKDGEGQLIHEFPSYSFILGDLHAHVTDIMNVLLIVMMLLGFLMRRWDRMTAARESDSYEKVDVKYLINEALDPAVIMASFIIGIISMTNSWDFPIYIVVSGAIICFSNAVITGFNKNTLILTGLHAFECVMISLIVSLPFRMHFESMTAGIGFPLSHSDPYELAVLWALPIAISVGLFMISLNRYKVAAGVGKKVAKGKVAKRPEHKRGFIYKKVKDENEAEEKKDGGINHLFSFIYRLEFSDLFVLTLAACAAGLVLMCEVVYVRDIYGSDYARTNTMFKLGYQAFILFGIVMTYTVTRLILFNETLKQRKLAVAGAFFIIWTIFYFNNACTGYIGHIFNPDGRERTLNSYDQVAESERSSMFWFKQQLGGDQVNNIFSGEEPSRAALVEDMVKWVMENTEMDDVISQMVVSAYKPFATISSFTGRPAPIGWYNHEWLWRNGGSVEKPQKVIERQDDMLTLYSTSDPAVAKAIIDKYDIDYIYVGYTEALRCGPNDKISSSQDEQYTMFYRESWYAPTSIDYEMLKSFGDVVYDAGTQVYSIYPNKDNGAGGYEVDRSYEPLYSVEYEAFIVKVRK